MSKLSLSNGRGSGREAELGELADLRSRRQEKQRQLDRLKKMGLVVGASNDMAFIRKAAASGRET